MADGVEEGRPWGFIGFVAAIVVGAFIFILLVTGGGSRNADLPALGGKGLAWAVDDLKKAGFEEVSAYDAWGRDRSSDDDKDWRVCFQTPAPGEQPTSTTVRLGVVLVTQECPTDAEGGDQGVRHAVQDTMPDVVGRTPYMVREDFGDEASLRFVDREGSTPEEVKVVEDDLGDWQVCTQSVPAGAKFIGQPVEMQVVGYGRPC
jgi:hypothetical protein